MSATYPDPSAAHTEVKAEIAQTASRTAPPPAPLRAASTGAWPIARELPPTLPVTATSGVGMAVLVAAEPLPRSPHPNRGDRHGSLL
ncbi:hypothetical protein ACWD5V_21615 [Streptomyces sp. NPDC002523]